MHTRAHSQRYIPTCPAPPTDVHTRSLTTTHSHSPCSTRTSTSSATRHPLLSPTSPTFSNSAAIFHSRRLKTNSTAVVRAKIKTTRARLGTAVSTTLVRLLKRRQPSHALATRTSQASVLRASTTKWPETNAPTRVWSPPSAPARSPAPLPTVPAAVAVEARWL